MWFANWELLFSIRQVSVSYTHLDVYKRQEMIYAENDGEETFFIRNERTEFTVSVVHSRKLTLRVAAEMELGRERMRDEELTTDAESDFPVYKKRQKMNVSELKISKKDTYRIKEEIVLPGTKESIGQILFFDISGRKAEIRPGQDELLIRGEAEVFCMYPVSYTHLDVYKRQS